MPCIILENVSQRSVLEIAALASAAMPELSVATTRGSEQFITCGDKKDITTAVITSIEGVEYDVSVASSAEGSKILKDRAKAAYVLTHSKTPVGFSFALEDYKLFVPSNATGAGVTGENAVYITPHNDGNAIVLRNLTSDQCAAAGSAIAAFHRLRTSFLTAAHYRGYTSEQIHKQLTVWISTLENAGHIPSEIIDNWKAIIATEGLWNFQSCPVHGGFNDGDIIFTSNSVTALLHFENMQISDPARDLAWIFTQLDKPRRNAFISAYSRVMGTRLDNMIWLRAGLWTQMEQVGEYMRALTHGDTAKILAFKSQVNSLAHQIARNNPQRSSQEKKTTLTVGDLLENPSSAQGKEETRKRGGAAQMAHAHAAKKSSSTRFIADSGVRIHASSQIPAAPQGAEMTDDSGDNTASAHVKASQTWNTTPAQSENFSLSSNSASLAAAESSDAVVHEVETIAMQAQSAAAAAAHAQEMPYTTQSSYVRIDSNGFVLDSSETSGGSTLENVAPEDSSADAYANGERYITESDYDEDSTGESAIVQDDVQTIVFASQEKDNSNKN